MRKFLQNKCHIYVKQQFIAPVMPAVRLSNAIEPAKAMVFRTENKPILC